MVWSVSSWLYKRVSFSCHGQNKCQLLIELYAGRTAGCSVCGRSVWLCSFCERVYEPYVEKFSLAVQACGGLLRMYAAK